MNIAPYDIDASARSQDADIWFALPPGFVPLPLRELTQAGTPEAQAAYPDDTLRPLIEALPDEASRQRLLVDLGPLLRTAQLLVEIGTVHCSLGMHADDEGDGGVLLSLFTLTWRATSWAPRGVLAARAVANVEGAEHIEILAPPCGPAALLQTRLAGPAEAGPAARRRLVQVTGCVPCPDGRRIAILTLATTAVEHSKRYRALLRDIVGAVSFDNPLPEAFGASSEPSSDVFGED
ncbi:hypothetical protein ABZT03_23085 [Streptomyces sp. NPDC005574]|uniref:hypothetical protein n=1 Tax=Streptomyces sp. NPDC005574 TaxID=3156891 RepID=UPI0033A53332